MFSFRLEPSSNWSCLEFSCIISEVLFAARIELISLITPDRFYLVAMPFSKTRRFSRASLVYSLNSRSFSRAKSSFSVFDSRPNGLLELSSIMVSNPPRTLWDGRGGSGTGPKSPLSGPRVYPLPRFLMRPKVGKVLMNGSSIGPAEFRPPRVHDLALFGPTEFLKARVFGTLLIANATS
jgi:hypothetical protein